MSDALNLPAEARDRAGKGASRALRREGRVPAVIYGGKEEPTTIHVEEKELVRQLGTGHFMNSIVMVDVAGNSVRTLPKDVAFHPVSDRPTHVDFLRLGKDAKIQVSIPVVFVDEEESPGLKKGGVLNVVRHELDLVCEADKIPSEIEVSVEGRDVGDSLHISEVKLPAGSESAITDRDFTIATLVAPSALKKSESETEDGEAPAADEVEATAQSSGDSEGEDRHNVGFMACDVLADMYGFGPEQKKFQGWLREGRIGNTKILLLKPATFMNESGRSVGEALRFYKLGTEALTVFHDELDIEPFKVKVKQGGGHAGHNGLRSVTQHCDAEFRRVRLGIGHPGHKAAVNGYVLGNYAKSEQDGLVSMLGAVAAEAEWLSNNDIPRFLSEVSLRLND